MGVEHSFSAETFKRVDDLLGFMRKPKKKSEIARKHIAKMEKRKPIIIFELLPKREKKKKTIRIISRCLKPQILERDNNSCANCHSKKDLHLHHKKYTTNPGDLIILCQKCHNQIHKKN